LNLDDEEQAGDPKGLLMLINAIQWQPGKVKEREGQNQKEDSRASPDEVRAISQRIEKV